MSDDQEQEDEGTGTAAGDPAEGSDEVLQEEQQGKGYGERPDA